MAIYIGSQDNRIYVGREASYGTVPPTVEGQRFPVTQLAVRQAREQARRHDKTGTRTYFGAPVQMRKRTEYALKTYLGSWDDQSQEPAYGPLFEAAMGRAAVVAGGAAVVQAGSAAAIQLQAGHGLQVGQAVTWGDEMRFVTALPGGGTVSLNAPFSVHPTVGGFLGTTATYRLGPQLPSVSIYDFWTPASALQRVVSGAGVARMRVQVNGEFNECEFHGPAVDVFDNASFEAGQGQLSAFPQEPDGQIAQYSLVPGYLGQVWMGSSPNRFYTLTEAELTLDNGVELRNNEFGRETSACIVAGVRTVTLKLRLFADDSAASTALYQAARQRTPISCMIQLGSQQGQLCGLYLKSFVPELPELHDNELRLQWAFADSRAQGVSDDELVIAFG